MNVSRIIIKNIYIFDNVCQTVFKIHPKLEYFQYIRISQNNN